MKLVTLRGELLVLWEDLNRDETRERSQHGEWVPKLFGPERLTGAQVHQRLKDLPDSATLAEIQAIAGHVEEVDLHLTCDECKQEVTQLLHLGHGLLHTVYAPKGYDLCAKCVHAAFALWETQS